LYLPAGRQGLQIEKSEISKKKKTFEKLLGDGAYGQIGVVSEGETLHIVGLHGKKIIEANIYDLKEAWQKPLRF
jgi:phosphoribosylformylglycinamidine synthase